MPPRSKPIPAYIEAGTVLTVDAPNWRVSVKTDVSHATFRDCLIAQPYHHNMGGEGMGCIPEVGAHVWVCRPSEGDALPFVIGFMRLPSTGSGSHAAGSEPHVPGDMFITTRDGNGFKAHRGGVTEEGATPICRRFYFPIGNKIHDIAQNYRLDTLNGSLTWLTALEEEDPEGKQGSLFRQTFKEYTSDKSHVAELQIGGQIEGGAACLLRVLKDGDVAEDSLEEAVSLSLTKEGAVHLKAAADVVIELQSGKSVSIYSSSGNEQNVILGRSYLTDQLSMLTELQGLLSTLGLVLPGMTSHITNLTTALSSGAPYLSTYLKTE